MIIANMDTLISKGFYLDNISNELDTLIKERVFIGLWRKQLGYDEFSS